MDSEDRAWTSSDTERREEPPEKCIPKDQREAWSEQCYEGEGARRGGNSHRHTQEETGSREGEQVHR